MTSPSSRAVKRSSVDLRRSGGVAFSILFAIRSFNEGKFGARTV